MYLFTYSINKNCNQKMKKLERLPTVYFQIEFLLEVTFIFVLKLIIK